MQKILVEICMCTECVMNGAMEIMDSVEDLKSLTKNSEIIVKTNTCLTGEKHSAASPLVSVNGKNIDRADSETIMAYIMNLVSCAVN